MKDHAAAPRRNSVAVVTGASRGIGEAVARALAGRGVHCVLVARGEERLRGLAGELGGEFELCDVADRNAVDAAAARILARHPRVTVLVNNAGIPVRADFLRADPEPIEQVVRVNYLGGVWWLRALLAALEAAAPSHVVNVVSVAGTIAYPPSGPYAASKHAQLAFSRATSAQLRRRGIHVHTILPGFVETEGFPQRTRLQPAILRRFVIEPEDVARRVLDAIDRDRREVVVPRWYRAAALAQAVVPGLLSRALTRTGYERKQD